MSIHLRYIERLRDDVTQAIEGDGPELVFVELSVNSLDLEIEVSTALLEPVEVVAGA